MDPSAPAPQSVGGLTVKEVALRLRRQAEQLTKRVAYPARNVVEFSRLRRASAEGVEVTAVVVGRNDDYMADFAQRLVATIAWNIRQAVTEVVFVEWNPPSDRPLLAPELTARFQQVRSFVVTPDVHAALCRNPHLKLLEYHAKNVGVRRASCPWVLATNADVVLGLDTVRRLRQQDLREGTAYTAERVDIRWLEGRSHPLTPRDFLAYRRIITHHPYGTGDFLLASRSAWHQACGYDESLREHRYGCDRRGVGQLVHHGSRVEKVGRILHLAHPTSCSESIRLHHGEWADLDGLPYSNPHDWGLASLRQVEVGERVWRIE